MKRRNFNWTLVSQKVLRVFEYTFDSQLLLATARARQSRHHHRLVSYVIPTELGRFRVKLTFLESFNLLLLLLDLPFKLSLHLPFKLISFERVLGVQSLPLRRS